MELIYATLKQFFFFCFLFCVTSVLSQSGVPRGSCGIQYSYDGSGNMADRKYVCNNAVSASVEQSKPLVEGMTVSVQAVDVLYPNPTTGRFTLQMVKPLQNAQLVVVDMQGRVVERRRASGKALQFDLSRQAAGMYILHIQDEGETFSAKVVKQ